VKRITGLWTELRGFVRRRRVQLALSIRVTVAALVALALAQILHLHLPLWAVMTAVIVTQMSVGRSLKATFDYLLGTLGGAIYGGAIGVLIPHLYRGDKPQIFGSADHRHHRAAGAHFYPDGSDRVGA
jgi:uncharacterized membrane protein YccC